MFILDSPIKTSISGYFPATRHDDTQASHQKGPTCYFAVDCSGWICTDSQCRPVQFTAVACCEMSISILSNYSNSRSCRSCDHMLALKCKHQRCCFTCHQLHYGPSMAQHCITASCKTCRKSRSKSSRDQFIQPLLDIMIILLGPVSLSKLNICQHIKKPAARSSRYPSRDLICPICRRKVTGVGKLV